MLLDNLQQISNKCLTNKYQIVDTHNIYIHIYQVNSHFFYWAKGFSISFIPSKGEIRIIAVPRSTDKPNCLVFSVMYPVSKSVYNKLDKRSINDFRWNYLFDIQLYYPIPNLIKGRNP